MSSLRVKCYHCKGTAKITLNGWRAETYGTFDAKATRLTAVEVATRLGLQANTVTHRLERLRREGLVKRSRQKATYGNGPWTYSIT